MNKKKKNGVGLVYVLLVFVVIMFAGAIGVSLYFLDFGREDLDTVFAKTDVTTGEFVSAEAESASASLEESEEETSVETTTAPETIESTEAETESSTHRPQADVYAETVYIEVPTTQCETTTEYVEETVSYIDIVAAGDNLVHMSYYNSYYDESTGTYNFSEVFSYIEKYIQQADLAIINQEVPCAGEGTTVSGYPAFNAPHEALDVMAKLGFDVFTTATNHCLDKGYAGLVNTLDYLHENYPDVLTTGTYSSYEDSIKTPIIEVKGVKIAVLDYSYGTNGVTVKYDYSVNLLGDLDKLSEDITRAKQEADFVIVCCHWGREYYTGVISEQREYAKTIADLGADLIIGTHPHVVEPMEYIETEDGRSVPVYYSLGNFIAFQNVFPRPVGGLACITLRVDGGGVSIEKADLDFTFVSAINYAADKYDFKVFKVSDLLPAHVNAYCFGSSRFSYSDIVDFCKKMNPDWSL
ncbi:MAG: CapA family protein [Lachnospiraceae bacterium]|nr:CapA family protein [Lachnospiraceae bacterium]